MRLEKLPTGIRITAEDEVFLDLTTPQYEDIFYALPLDCNALYMLMNGTVLVEADDRAILQFIVEANGGFLEHDSSVKLKKITSTRDNDKRKKKKIFEKI